MTTKQHLKARWKTPEGKQKGEALQKALNAGTTLEQLHAIVNSLPYTDEVAPGLDLRGLQIDHHIFVRHLDLPGVRLDYATLRGNVSEGNWNRAVFDGANMDGVSFKLDLTQASFVKASARKAWFLHSVLHQTNFSEARLIGAHFDNVPCDGANFTEADMREATCPKCDFRRANLAGANLSGATFGSILFDANTKVEGANFTGTSLSKDFEAFVIEYGQQPKPTDESESEFATIEATIAVVQEQMRIGGPRHSLAESLLATLMIIHQRMRNDPCYDWEPFVESLPENEKALFYAAYEEGMGHYEDYM